MESRVPLHEAAKFLDVLQSAGLTETLSQKVIYSKGNKVARRMIEAINKKEEKVTNPFLAREIMGKNMFGVEEAIRYFGVHPDVIEMTEVSEIPWSVEVLKKAKNTHLLVAVFPLSILEIKERVDSMLFQDQNWYEKWPFAKERGTEASWQLIRKTPVENSASKTFREQLALVGKDKIPTAREMVYSLVGYALATGEHLFSHVFVRTSSEYSFGNYIVVGHFGYVGLKILSLADYERKRGWGVSSALKF